MVPLEHERVIFILDLFVVDIALLWIHQILDLLEIELVAGALESLEVKVEYLFYSFFFFRCNREKGLNKQD